MKLCSLCHWLLQRRRWLLLPIGLAVTLALFFLLPTWLWLALLGLLATLTAMLLVYLRDLRDLWTGSHSRMPAPRDAQAEIVMIDASLVDNGTQLQAAAQPVNAFPEMSLRMGSGALLLGTAMVFLSDELPEGDANALLSAVTALNLRAPVLRSHNPVLYRGTEDDMRVVTVQDGAQERSYFMADAKTVAENCLSIWEDRVRLMGANDRERVLDAAKYMASGGCRVLAFATATDDERPIFLGLAALGDGLDVEAVREMQELRATGLTLVLRQDDAAPVDIDALRRTLDVADLHARPDLCLSTGKVYPDVHCLTIRMDEDASLLAPIRRLREHFGCMAHMLRRLSRLMALCFLCCVLAGGTGSVLLTGMVLATAYLSFGSLATSRSIHWPAALIASAGSLLAGLLLRAAVPAGADCAGTVMCLTLAALLSLTLLPRTERLTPRGAGPLLIALGASLALHLLMSLPALPAALLSALFGAVCGGLVGMICLLVSR